MWLVRSTDRTQLTNKIERNVVRMWVSVSLGSVAWRPKEADVRAPRAFTTVTLPQISPNNTCFLFFPLSAILNYHSGYRCTLVSRFPYPVPCCPFTFNPFSVPRFPFNPFSRFPFHVTSFSNIPLCWSSEVVSSVLNQWFIRDSRL